MYYRDKHVGIYVFTEVLILSDPYRCSIHRGFGVTSCGPVIVAIHVFREFVFTHFRLVYCS